MYNEKVNKRTLAGMAAIMLLAATMISMATTENAFAYNKNQATSQTNDCGNGDTPIDVFCQNLASQIQGDHNTAVLAAEQGVEEAEPGPPPSTVGCPDETVWDITIRGAADEGGVPVGTVICLTEGLGNHPALVLTTPPITTNVNTNQPNVANCNAPGQQVAEVTSGTPPNPLNFGSLLCATVDLD